MVQPELTVTERTARAGVDALRVRSLSVDGYRGFHALRIGDLGRVNLITGRNNTGKTSLLEAIRILVHRASPRVIHEVVSYREGIELDDKQAPYSTGQPPLVAKLFNGYPFRISNQTLDQVIVSIKTEGTLIPSTITMQLANVVPSECNQKSTVIEGQYRDGDIVLVVGIDHERKEHLLNWPSSSCGRDQGENSLQFSCQETFGPVCHCVGVDVYGAQDFSRLGKLWDSIVLSKDQDLVIQCLNIIEPKITGVSMISDGHNSDHRRPFVRMSDSESPVTLRSMGIGISRLFEIIVSLVNARSGFLLIEELDRGLHYGVHFEVWKMILRLARELDAQVFATSHSGDAVKAFCRANAEDTFHHGALIKLERIRGEIVSTVFFGDELDIIARHQIEVR